MESTPNPYTTPSANLFGSTSGTAAEAVPQGAITQLKRTKPWVQFMAVMMFIAAAFMMLVGVGMGSMGALGGMTAAGADAPPGMAAFGAGMGIVMAAFYIVFGLLYLYPGVKMWKYGSRIGTLVKSASPVDLEAALNEQRIVWKFWGIITIVMIVLAVVGMIAAVGIGAAAAMSAGGLPK